MNVSFDTLTEIYSDYPLTEEQIAFYQENGHILLRGVCNPVEVATWRPVIADAVQRFKEETRKLEDRDTYGKAFLQIINIWERDEAVRKFVFGRRLSKIAAELMKVDGVRIYHDQALFKEQGGGYTPWHQDQFYFPLDTPNVITMWMPFVITPIESGSMVFASGSHTEGYLANMEISDASEIYFRQVVAEREFRVTTGELYPGDATFHAGWMLHKAAANSTDNTREVMTIIWYEDGARVAEPANASQEIDLKEHLPGLKPHDLAASPLNPLLYQRES